MTSHVVSHSSPNRSIPMRSTSLQPCPAKFPIRPGHPIFAVIAGSSRAARFPLLDAGEVKSIQQLFERDDAFREHVSRYIHDFESILRQILSTRDGNALGVTLLSSDMGKLYVALAQGIERLRS